MSTFALIPIGALLLTSAPQEGTALRDGLAAALGERSTDVRVVTLGGGDGAARLDADADGFVTREEFTAPMSTAFDRLDVDEDGRLSRDEMTSRDGDGHGGPMVFNLRREGAAGGLGGARGVTIFQGGPGDAREREVVVIRRGEPGEGVDILHGPGSGDRRLEIRRFGGPDGPGAIDTDGDGRVSEAEFLAPLRETFGRMDADGDGALEPGERPSSAD